MNTDIFNLAGVVEVSTIHGGLCANCSSFDFYSSYKPTNCSPCDISLSNLIM